MWQDALRRLAQNSKDGKFVDPEFEARPQDQQKKGKALPAFAVERRASAKKVDNWTRLETMTTDDGGRRRLALRQARGAPATAGCSRRSGWWGRAPSCSSAWSRARSQRRDARGAPAQEAVVTVVDDLMPCHGKGTARVLVEREPARRRRRPRPEGPRQALWLLRAPEHRARRLGARGPHRRHHDKIYLRDGLLGADQTEKQQFVSARRRRWRRARWRQLKGLRDGGHLLGASYRSKYAAAGDQPVMSSDRVDHLVYPIVEMREVDNLQLVRLANPWSKLEERQGPAAPEVEQAVGGGERRVGGVAERRGAARRQAARRRLVLDAVRQPGARVQQGARLPPPVVTHTERRVAGEWAKATAGGMLSDWPGSGGAPTLSTGSPSARRRRRSLARAGGDSAQFWRNSAQFCAIIPNTPLLSSSRSRSPARRWTPRGEGRVPTCDRLLRPRRRRATAAPEEAVAPGREGELAAASQLACTRQVCREVGLLPNVSYYVLPCRSTRTCTCRTSSPSRARRRRRSTRAAGRVDRDPAARRVVDRRGDGGRMPQLPGRGSGTRSTRSRSPPPPTSSASSRFRCGRTVEELSKQQAQLTQAAAEAAAGDADQAAARRRKQPSSRRRWASCSSKATAA